MNSVGEKITQNEILLQSGIDNIYVIHAKKGYELHEKRINELFGSLGLKYEFITDGDPSYMTDLHLEKYFCAGVREKMSVGTLSCTLNHILSYERMVQNKDRLAIILENDPFLLGDFVTTVSKIANEAMTLNDGILVSLENSILKFPSFWQTKKGKYLYKAKCGRFAGAYLVNQQGAQNMLEYLKIKKCARIIDWWHNEMIDNKIIDMYWAHPPVSEQGSHNGKTSAMISSKKKGKMRRLRWLLQKYYKMYWLRLFKGC
jgi:glycosyl transferase family 25